MVDFVGRHQFSFLYIIERVRSCFRLHKEARLWDSDLGILNVHQDISN